MRTVPAGMAGYAGLAEGVTGALTGTCKGVPAHAPGRVFTDLAVAVADGADAISGIGVLTDREELSGPVASMPATWRVLGRAGPGQLPTVRAARAKARAAAWAAGAGPDLGEELHPPSRPRRRVPAWPGAPGRARSSGSRRVHRWCGCGGSAAGDSRAALRPGRSRPSRSNGAPWRRPGPATSARPGLVDHQHRILVAQMLQHILTHAAGIPPGPAKQVLHAVRTRLPGPPGDRPAVLARQVRQQPQYQGPHPAPGLHPREPARYPAHQDLERLLPAGRVYAVTRGHRKIFSLHTPMISGGAASAAGSTSKITLYGWTSRSR
jgi:hypothetical protein